MTFDEYYNSKWGGVITEMADRTVMEEEWNDLLEMLDSGIEVEY